LYCLSLLDLHVLVIPLVSSSLRPLRDRQYNGLRIEDTKGVTRTCKSKRDRQCNGLRLEDTKGVTRICKSKRDRQYNGLRLEDTKGITRTCKSIVLSVPLRFTCSSYTFGIFKL
jgi:hypothetical protein